MVETISLNIARRHTTRQCLPNADADFAFASEGMMGPARVSALDDPGDQARRATSAARKSR